MELLTREERKQLIDIREDYLFILTEKVELRDSRPDFYQEIVDHYQAVTERLEDDEDKRIFTYCVKGE